MPVGEMVNYDIELIMELAVAGGASASFGRSYPGKTIPFQVRELEK